MLNRDPVRLDQIIDSLPGERRAKVMARTQKLIAEGKMTRLTVREAAAYIPLAKGTLDNMRTAGNGPRFIKLGRKILYDVKDLDQWIDAHKQSSTSDKPELRRRRRRRFNNPIDMRR